MDNYLEGLCAGIEGNIFEFWNVIVKGKFFYVYLILFVPTFALYVKQEFSKNLDSISKIDQLTTTQKQVIALLTHWSLKKFFYFSVLVFFIAKFFVADLSLESSMVSWLFLIFVSWIQGSFVTFCIGGILVVIIEYFIKNILPAKE